MQLALSFLGPFQAMWNGEPLAFATNTARALLAYLAVESDGPHPRDVLAAMLWPEQLQTSARTNLRQTLARVRRAVPKSDTVLRVTRLTLQFTRNAAAVDVARFEDLVAECAVHTHTRQVGCPDCSQRLEQAAALYRGEFLHGLSLGHSQPFDDWALLKREQLRRQAVEALHTLTCACEAAGDYEKMRRYATRQLALEPWREEAHRQLMRALAQMRQRSAALAQYQACRRRLADELGVAAEEATTALYEQIKAGESVTVPGPMRAPHEWGAAPETGRLYGRSAETAKLARWLAEDRRQVVAVLGIGGVGKTALAAATARTVAPCFDVVVWRSLLNAPPLDAMLRAVLPAVSRRRLTEPPASLDEQLDLLLEQLRQRRCLLVLDNLERILDAGPAGRYRAGYEGYGQLIQRMAETRHDGCLLVISREQPSALCRLEGDTPRLRSLPLTGLDPTAGQAMLAARGLSGQEAGAVALVQRYSGNPLALTLVAQTVVDLFNGDIGAFLAVEAPIFGDIRTMLDQQFARLSPLEQEILRWLAVEREPVTVPGLRENLVDPGPPRELVQALRALQRRCLLERDDVGAFTLQSVIMEYATDRLIDDACEAVVSGQPEPLSRHALLKAQATEHVRGSQARLILAPVAERLAVRLGLAGVDAALRRIITTLRAGASRVPGYAAGNALNVLLHLGVDVRGYDFSGLSVWQADLRGASLPKVDLSGADLTGSTFTDTFGITRSIALSQDGLLAVATDDGEIRLWRAADRQLRGIYRAHLDRVLSVAFASGGRSMASGSADGTARLWDVDTGQVRHTLEGHRGTVRMAVFSPDGQTVATASQDRTIRLWDVGTGACLRTLRGHAGAVWAVAFSPGGQSLVSGGADRTVCIWDAPTGRVRRVLEGHTGLIAQVAFSPDGATVASCGTDQTVRVWDTGSGQAPRCLEGHTNMVWSIGFSPDGKSLASVGADRTIRLWDTGTWQARHTLHGHGDAVHTVVFAADGQTLTSGSRDQTIRVWDARTAQCRMILRGHAPGVTSLSLSPDGELLASGGHDHAVRLWDAGGRRACAVLRGHTQAVMAVAFSPDGATLASASVDQTLRLWDTRSGQALATLAGHTQKVSAVAFDPTGELVASASEDGTIRLWDVRNRHARGVLRGHAHWVPSVAFSPDGATLASASLDETVGLWDARAGTLRATLDGGGGGVWCVAFRPGGAVLAAASQDGPIRLWDLASGRVRATLCGHDERARSVAFSPDGGLLASGGLDRTVRLWDVRTGACQRILDGHTGWVWAVAFAQDGRTLASCSGDGTIRRWSVATGECLDTLRAEGPYAGMNIAGVTGVSQAQRAALIALGAVENGLGTTK